MKRDVDIMDFNEKTFDRTVIYNGKIIDLELHDVELPDGKTSKREIIKHNGAVAICAITPEKEVLLVKQYRLSVFYAILQIRHHPDLILLHLNDQ